MREFLANVFAVGTGVALLWHFSLIAIHGPVIIQEPSAVVLAMEIIVLVGIVCFGMVNIIRILPGSKRP